MKSLLIALLISLVCYSHQTIEKAQVIKFDNDQDAQESIEFTMCLNIITYPEFLEYVKQLIEEGEFPEGSDLEKTALSVCLSVSQSCPEFKSNSTSLIPKARAGELILYNPKVKDLKPTPYSPLLPQDDFEINLKKGDGERRKGIFKAIGTFIVKVAKAVVELIKDIRNA